MKTKKAPKKKLNIRNARISDLDGINKLVAKVYPEMGTYPNEMLTAQIQNFPEGVFVAIYNGEIVGYSASLRISEHKAFSPHTWGEITAGGYGSTHEGNGEYLYGYETCVDPDVRGLKIGQRLYNERKNLVKYFRLKGIVFAGRIPNYRKKIKEVSSPEDYVNKVAEGKIKDPVLNFQIRNGFEVIGILENYLKNDLASGGYAVHLVWKNPEHVEEQKSKKTPSSIRLATVQYGQRKIKSFDEFKQLVEYFVDVVSDYKADFAVFPELFSLQLLSIENKEISPLKAIRTMAKYSDRIKKMFSEFAIKYNINIVGGSHIVQEGDDYYNEAFVFLRDGRVFGQKKIHPTPNEKYWWKLKGGETLTPIDTDCGPIGVLVCYDSEFPELTRHLVNQGIKILFVPYLTDERHAYCRVRYCCQARAVENQIYVAMAGNVGNLPNVHNMDIQYGQSCILTPCDFQFSREGVAADSTPNVEMVSFADVRLDSLQEARNTGTVQNLKDRRHDLYSVRWHKKH